MDITYRYSKWEDAPIIEELFNKCFGSPIDSGFLDYLNLRYLLAFDNDKLVAMTGITGATYYSGMEIDWTCCDEDYRHNGIITTMLRECLKRVDVDVYCACHHSEPYYFMKELGFKLLMKNSKYFKAPNCKSCALYHDGMQCECHEDLYIRRR